VLKAAAGEQAHYVAVAADDEAVTVVLDLMHPTRSSWRLRGAGRDAGLDEAIGVRSHAIYQGRRRGQPLDLSL
jgi:hypothetical protein